MEITVNGEVKIIESNSLALLITHQTNGLTDGIAVAVNNDIIPKSNWQNISLNEKDNVLIIKATQGG